MNKTKLTMIMSATILVLIIITSCNNDDTQNQKKEIQVKFIEQICCGNLMTLNNVLIGSRYDAYKDSLLYSTNFGDFPIFQSLQLEDIITIEYELTESSEGDCEIMCNRHNGIPIKLLKVEK